MSPSPTRCSHRAGQEQRGPHRIARPPSAGNSHRTRLPFADEHEPRAALEMRQFTCPEWGLRWHACLRAGSDRPGGYRNEVSAKLPATASRARGTRSSLAAIRFRIPRAIVGRSVTPRAIRPDWISTRLPMGWRSSWWVSSTSSPAPERTASIFHARFAASWIPVFMPCPPIGEWKFAASPREKHTAAAILGDLALVTV